MIRLGPAGNCDKDILSSLNRLPTLGLQAQEVEFTYGVKMSNETAKAAGELARKNNLQLSVHAPYYINLLSEDKKKIEASKQRILMSAERGHYLGATHIVFHAGFYGKLSKEQAYEDVKKQMVDLQETIKKNSWKTAIAPETTGKASQFGDLDELLRLRKETGCEICVDFAHLHARNGSIDYEEVFDKLKSLKHIQSHFSGIEFTPKGERRHLIMEKADFLPLAKQILRRKSDITIICESPVTWQDSLKMKEILGSVKMQDSSMEKTN